MKHLGQILIAIGFLIGALLSVLDELLVPWGYFAVALGVGVAGVALVNLGERRAAQAIRASGAGVADLDQSLSLVVKALETIDAQKADMNPYDVRLRIDEEIPEPLTAFVESRETMIHIYGLQPYADVMSHFAAAERYMNRAWSASADGYVDEVNIYIPKAHREFAEALRILRSFETTA